MLEPQKQCSLVDELDQRQNDVLTQLEALNDRVEALVRDCLASRSTEKELLEA